MANIGIKTLGQCPLIGQIQCLRFLQPIKWQNLLTNTITMLVFVVWWFIPIPKKSFANYQPTLCLVTMAQYHADLTF